ncbi:MAG: ABC transporter ATP-binding protein [Bacteroidia bacterium]
MEEVLSVNSLKKYYGRFPAVQDVSFQVGQGQVFGLLGPNGSGKTTLLGCISGILNPSSGNFNWFKGEAFDDARKKVGSLIETPNFFPYLSASENLKICAKVKKTNPADIDRVLDETGLLARKNDAFRKFSLGMKQRLAIAAALLGNPTVLVLDEPTNGLDPEGINEIRDLILRQQKMGKTVILASHLLYEVEKVCTDVVILKKGNVLKSGKVNEILAGTGSLKISAENPEKLGQMLGTLSGIAEIREESGVFTVKLSDNQSPANINETLVNAGVRVNHLQVTKSDLESEFLKLIKE